MMTTDQQRLNVHLQRLYDQDGALSVARLRICRSTVNGKTYICGPVEVEVEFDGDPVVALAHELERYGAALWDGATAESSKAYVRKLMDEIERQAKGSEHAIRD